MQSSKVLYRMYTPCRCIYKYHLIDLLVSYTKGWLEVWSNSE